MSDAPTIVVIRRPFTVMLLIIVTIGIGAITIGTSGRNYSSLDPMPFEDLRHIAHRLQHATVSTRILALTLLPVVANILLFVPWGFLMFIALYTVERPTVQTYVLTMLLGITLTCVIEGWQYFMPSRVADVNDIIWNTTGTLAGAIAGHLRERVRFEFD